MLCEWWQLSTVILKPLTALFWKINENSDGADKPQQGTHKKLRYPPIRVLIVVKKITCQRMTNDPEDWTDRKELVYDLLIVQVYP